MAKISRSISVGENLGLAAETQAPAPVRVSPLSKLALPSRAHLVLDIPKPLPDRPTLATFSPVTKGRSLGEVEQPGSPVGLGKAHSTSEKQAYLGEGTPPRPRTECQAQPGPNSSCAQHLPVGSLLQGPENLQSPPHEKTPSLMECTRPGEALSQASGVHGPSSYLLPHLSSVFVGCSGSIPFLCIQPLAFFILSIPVSVPKSTPDGRRPCHLQSSPCNPLAPRCL